MGSVEHKDTEKHSENDKIQNSPVLNALRSHIEKWYPAVQLDENGKKLSKLEVEDMLGEDVA